MSQENCISCTQGRRGYGAFFSHGFLSVSCCQPLFWGCQSVSRLFLTGGAQKRWSTLVCHKSPSLSRFLVTPSQSAGGAQRWRPPSRALARAAPSAPSACSWALPLLTSARCARQAGSLCFLCFPFLHKCFIHFSALGWVCSQLLGGSFGEARQNCRWLVLAQTVRGEHKTS